MCRAWYRANRERALAYAKAYRSRPGFREKAIEYNAKYRAENPDIMKAAQKSWRERNPEKVKASLSAWAAKNVDRKRELRRLSASRAKLRPEHRIRRSIRKTTARIRRMAGESPSASKLLGAPLPVVRNHIESLFQHGMAWSDQGTKWHIDHIIPLAAFDLTDPTQLAMAAHYTNLQPLWAADNMRKRDKILPEYLPPRTTSSPSQPILATL